MRRIATLLLVLESMLTPLVWAASSCPVPANSTCYSPAPILESKSDIRRIQAEILATYGLTEMQNKDLESESDEDLFQMLDSARKRGIKQLVIDPFNPDIVKVDSADKFPSGDLFLFTAFNPDGIDESIRQADYELLYPAIRRVSALRFRVTINLFATIQDLRDALRSKRPGIIIWSGHGTPGGFYDAAGEAIPEDIFKNASPSIYQFVLSACNGTQAMRDKYQKFAPNGFRWYAWDGITNATHLSDYLNSSDWSPLTNRPEPIHHRGMFCAADQQDLWFIRLEKGGALNGWGFTTQEGCNLNLVTANDDFICNAISNDEYAIISLKTNKPIEGINFSANEAMRCRERAQQSFNGRTCRRLAADEKVHVVPSNTGTALPSPTWETVSDCIQYIHSSQTL